jgi:hypothetical protein
MADVPQQVTLSLLTEAAAVSCWRTPSAARPRPHAARRILQAALAARDDHDTDWLDAA